MLGYVIATHGQLAAGLLDAVELIAGKQERVAVIGLNHADSIEEFTGKLQEEIERFGTDGEVIVFTDMLGASPYNSAVKCVGLVRNVTFRVMTGTNLGMLIEGFLQREIHPEWEAEEMSSFLIKKGKESVTELYHEISKMKSASN